LTLAEYKTEIGKEVGDRGVVHPGHPPVIESVIIAAGKAYPAGTLLKYAASGALAAAKEVTGGSAVPAEQSDCVLVEDIDTTGEARPARCLLHGTVVRSRLLCSTGTPEPASSALVEKLSARGIYAVQGGFDYSVMA
jgi:hypothetical protein